MLTEVFGAEQLRRFDNSDGTIMHVEVKIDDSVIMISDAGEGYRANQSLIHVYVPDVHATFQKAIRHGCDAIKQPINEPNDPDVRGMFKDFQGNVWTIGTQVE